MGCVGPMTNPSWPLTVRDTSGGRSGGFHLVILDLNSGAMSEIAGQDNWTSEGCWSPDDKKLVFTEQKVGINNVLLFDVEQGKAKFLVKGSGASWSPDGSWIAFSSTSPDSYFVIRPDGYRRKTVL